MDDIKFTDDMKNYELNYWKKNLYANNNTISLDALFPGYDKNLVKNAKIAIDIGCGPYCGIFRTYKFKKMICVDPLIDMYKATKIMIPINDIILISGSAQEFDLEEKADVAFSFNALDHSGSFRLSIYNIMRNLSDDGSFFFHVHMRKNDQLNTGHKMALNKETIEDIIFHYRVISARIVGKCPLSGKNYASYLGILTK